MPSLILNRPEERILIDAYNAEIEVLMDYMPKQLTADEITGYRQENCSGYGYRTGQRQEHPWENSWEP